METTPEAASSARRRRTCQPSRLLFPSALLLCLLPGCVQSASWMHTLRDELASTTFGGVRLCTVPQATSVNVTATDTFQVASVTSPGATYNVKSTTTLYVSSCIAPSSVDGTYFYMRIFLVESTQWGGMCDNTRNLTISMGITGSSQSNYSVVQPCNYTTQHAGLSTEQVTAWILLTYTADWNPNWVNRTADNPEAVGAATVVLRSATQPLYNATWCNVLASDLLSHEAMTPAQQAQAVLASISVSPTNWWQPICDVLRSPGNLLVSVANHGASNTTTTTHDEWHMDCSGPRTTLVWGPPSSPAGTAGEATAAVLLTSSSGGYWGPALHRLLTTQPIGGIEFCNATTTGGILVSAVDDIAVQGPSAIVRATFSLQVAPCSASNVSVALGDAYLKTLLRSEANWTDVCADSVEPKVVVNLAGRTAVQFSPCPQPDAATDPGSVAAKAAWCVLALNASKMGMQWLRRDTVSAVEASAASVTFSVLGSGGGAPNATTTVLQWGNVLVNGLTSGSQAERLVRAFQLTDTAYWPVICRLVGAASNGSFLSIVIAANDNSSRPVNLYANCSASSELSGTLPPGYLTTTRSVAETTATTVAATAEPSTKTTTTTTEPSTTTTAPIPHGSTTLSPEEKQKIVQQQNREEITAQKERNELGTQIAVIMVAVLVLLVLASFGICKMVLPRNA